MIVTVCLNPCIDRNYYVDRAALHALNRANRVTESLSGKGINVAIAAARLGGKVCASGFMYSRDAARYSRRLHLEGAAEDFVTLEGSTRVNVKIIESGGELTEFNERGARLEPGRLSELKHRLTALAQSADAVVFSGSLPTGADADTYAYLAHGLDTLVAVDADGGALLGALSVRPALLKPNAYELTSATGLPCSTPAEVGAACRALHQRCGARVLCSLGGGGAVYFDGSSVYAAAAPKVEVVSSVGAGDSMLAAAVLALCEGADSKELLERAVAAGSAACLTEGTGLVLKDDYLKLRSQVTAQQIK